MTCNCFQPGLGGDCDGSCQHPEPDIVQKLRDRALFAREEHTGTADADAWHFAKAADEIEQLRKALASIVECIWRDDEPYDERIGDLKHMAAQALEGCALSRPQGGSQ